MAFLDKLSETLVSAGKDVGQKAKDLSGTAKLTIDVKSKEDYVRRMYAEIGKAYYEEHKNDAEPMYEQINMINEAMQTIEELKAELVKLKGCKVCIKCGKEVGENDTFCKNCGAKIEDIFEDEDDIVVDAVVTDVQEEASTEDVSED